MSDLPLFDHLNNLREDLTPLHRVEATRGMTNRERFDLFHARNPQVYRLIVKMARRAKQLGQARWGIAGIFEQLRWLSLETHGDVYVLNNTYRAYYARLVMDQEPDLAGFFEVRGSAHDPEYYDREVRA